MPNEGVINNARSIGIKIKDASKRAIEALRELQNYSEKRNQGTLDLTAIDYTNDPIFGNLGTNDLDKALDNANDLISNAGNLFRVIR